MNFKPLKGQATKMSIIIAGIIFLLGSCESSDGERVLFDGSHHWADTVYAYSTQYNTGSFSAKQILGKPTLWPDACECGGSWASQTKDGQREYIEIGFSQHQGPASSIALFENYGPGAVDSIYVKNPSGAWQLVWSGKWTALAENSTRIFVASFPKTSFDVTDVRIAVASDSALGWNEYDAVAISRGVLPTNYDTTGAGSFVD